MISYRPLSLARSVSISRFFSSERLSLTPKDVKIIKNPGEKYINAFLETAGGLKGDVKQNDFATLRNCFGDNYNLYLLCLKDSTEIVSAGHVILYKSLLDKSNDFQSWGMTWNPPKYQTSGLLSHLLTHMSEDLGAAKMNSGGCADPPSAADWRKSIHTKVRGNTYYVSHYNVNDFVDPKLSFENITVKNFNDISSDDLVGYDQSIFPYERSKYMITRFKEGFGRVAYNKKGKVIGMGVVTPYPSGDCVIGPLYCDNRETAQAIFQSILKELRSSDLKRVQVRCSDKFEASATWIRPFLRCKHEMTLHSHVKFNRVIPIGLDFSKVFVNSNPANAPL